MAETKGITIDFYGNTLEFDKSIDGINKALKLTKNELSTLNKELKLDPSNVDKITEKFNKLKQQQSLLAEQVDMYKKRLAELGNYNDLTKEQQKEFEAISKALGSCEVELAKVNQQLASMPTANLQKLSKEFDEIGNKLNNIGSKVESLGKALTPLSVATSGLIASGIKYNATLEQQTALFTTLTGSAEQAEKVLSAIKGDAMKSPFDTQSLISANQYLIATGMEADKSREVIMALGDAISATGGGNSELQRMAQNLQQVQNVGKASSMDMKQFAMAGIDIWGILADSTGKTVKELQEMDISFEMIADALTKASQEGGKYYGAMEMQSQTLTGSITNLKAQFSELLGELTEMFLPVIKEIIAKVQEWIEKIRGLDENQKNLISRIALIVATAGPLLTVVGKLIGSSGLGGLATGISKILKSEKLIAFFGKVASAGGGLSGVISTLAQTFTGLLNPITLIIGALALAYATNEDFRKTVNELVKSFLTSLKPAFEVIKTTINSVITVVGNIINVIVQLVSKIATLLAPLLNAQLSIMGNIISVISSLAALLINTLFYAINIVVNIILELVNRFKSLFSTLANTTFGQGFISVMQSIGSAIESVIGWVQSAISWFKNAIDFGNQLLGIQNATNSNQQRYTQTGNKGSLKDGRALASGGFGDIQLTTNIHIDNTGMPIDEQEVNRWVNAMTDKLDIALGGRL
jgi:tape measure domain-containing protein